MHSIFDWEILKSYQYIKGTEKFLIKQTQLTLNIHFIH